MASRVLIDAGPMVAIASANDRYHDLCADQGESVRPPASTCWPAVTEAAWLPRHDLEAWNRVFDSFSTGLYRLLPLSEADLPRIREIMSRYSDLGAQLADAALVRLAEREDFDTIFSLDQHDFQVYCLEGNRYLNVIP